MRQVTLTEQNIMDGASRFGAWSKVQLALIGVSWPPKKGWKEKVIGRSIDEDDLSKFLSLKDRHKEVSGQPNNKVNMRKEYNEIANRKNLI